MSVGRPSPRLRRKKIIYNKAYQRGAKLGSDHVDMLEEVTKVELVLLPENERNKILNQRTRDAKKATDKALKEATRVTTKASREASAAVEKEAKKVEKSGKSKAITPPLLLTKTSIASPLQNPHKQDASFVQFLMSRMQQITSPSLMDFAGGACSRIHLL